MTKVFIAGKLMAKPVAEEVTSKGGKKYNRSILEINAPNGGKGKDGYSLFEVECNGALATYSTYCDKDVYVTVEARIVGDMENGYKFIASELYPQGKKIVGEIAENDDEDDLIPDIPF